MIIQVKREFPKKSGAIRSRVFLDNIMFHGGNTIDETKGCILCAYNRDGEQIQGDASNDLFKRVDGAYRAGEGVEVHFTTPAKNALLAGGAILVAGATIHLIKKG